jgi:hypothetical protein
MISSQKRRHDRGVNLIGGGTDAPRAADRRSSLAANSGIRGIEARPDVSEERD